MSLRDLVKGSDGIHSRSLSQGQPQYRSPGASCHLHLVLLASRCPILTFVSALLGCNSAQELEQYAVPLVDSDSACGLCWSIRLLPRYALLYHLLFERKLAIYQIWGDPPLIESREPHMGGRAQERSRGDPMQCYECSKVCLCAVSQRRAVSLTFAAEATIHWPKTKSYLGQSLHLIHV
jgi:hypothetical protein